MTKGSKVQRLDDSRWRTDRLVRPLCQSQGSRGKGAVVAGRNAGIDQCQRRDRSAERADVLADREGASKQVERYGVETGPTDVDAGQDPFQTNGERLNARCLVDSSGNLEGKATELIDDRRA